MTDYSTKWNEGMTFEQYLSLVKTLVAEGKSTGPNQSEDLLEYSKMNLRRMQRILKTFEVSEYQMHGIKALGATNVLAITEGWCGDAAQIIPVASKVMDHLAINFKLVLRDEHLDLIDHHLTNGRRSIPILLFLNDQFELLAEWGPRPYPVQQKVIGFKNKPEPKPPYTEFVKEVQLWYHHDKQKTMLDEWNNFK